MYRYLINLLTNDLWIEVCILNIIMMQIWTALILCYYLSHINKFKTTNCFKSTNAINNVLIIIICIIWIRNLIESFFSLIIHTIDIILVWNFNYSFQQGNKKGNKILENESTTIIDCFDIFTFYFLLIFNLR